MHKEKALHARSNSPQMHLHEQAKNTLTLEHTMDGCSVAYTSARKSRIASCQVHCRLYRASSLGYCRLQWGGVIRIPSVLAMGEAILLYRHLTQYWTSAYTKVWLLCTSVLLGRI